MTEKLSQAFKKALSCPTDPDRWSEFRIATLNALHSGNTFILKGYLPTPTQTGRKIELSFEEVATFIRNEKQIAMSGQHFEYFAEIRNFEKRFMEQNSGVLIFTVRQADYFVQSGGNTIGYYHTGCEPIDLKINHILKNKSE